MLTYPNIDPVAVAIGPLKVHWYGLMYLVGFIGSWWLGVRRAQRPDIGWSRKQVEDLIFFGALGVVAALYHRALHPDAPGQEIALSLTEAMLKILEVLAIKADQIGETHERIGNENAFVAPAGVFRAADGHWVTVTCASQSIFERFCTLLGRPEMIRDARFANNAVRMEHRHELNAILGGWVAERRVKDVVATLMEAGVSAAPVYDARQILEDPHFTARAAVTSVEDRDFGAVKMPGLVPRFSHTPGEIRSSGPEPGAHNDEVYRDLLGLSPDELEQLRAEGVV